MKKPCFFFPLLVFFLLGTLFVPCLFSADEIIIQDISAKEIAPQRFTLKYHVSNATVDSREVVLRSQIEVFDRAVPAGDLPVNILRKDQTLVLKPGESRDMSVDFVGQGQPAKGDLRVSPVVRIRRQRVWNY